MLAEFLIKVWKLFASHVLLNKRRLTGNRPGSARRETGRKKSLPQHPYRTSHELFLHSEALALIIREM